MSRTDHRFLRFPAGGKLWQSSAEATAAPLAVGRTLAKEQRMTEKIVLDIDGAGDDILAVLYAAGHPDIELLGVTSVTGAAGAVEQVTKVALNALTTGRA